MKKLFVIALLAVLLFSCDSNTGLRDYEEGLQKDVKTDEVQRETGDNGNGGTSGPDPAG